MLKNKLIKITVLALLPAWFLVGCATRSTVDGQCSDVRPGPVGTSDHFPIGPSDLSERGVRTSAAASSTNVMPIANTFVDAEKFAHTAGLRAWPYQGRPLAGVVNHHVVAMDLMAKFFKTLKNVRPDIETFVILSPDHLARGKDVSTSRLSYNTPTGESTVDGRWSKDLYEYGAYDGTEGRMFENEHGVGALAPFIKREFPEAKIVPVFLGKNVSRQRLESLGRALASFADEKTFVVVSSDMSHYLRREDAAARDRETTQWLARGDWPLLESATDKNTDSASAFAVLREYLNLQKGVGRFELLGHAISTDYIRDPLNTTSYIVGLWD